MNMACAKSAERESGQIGGLGVFNIVKKERRMERKRERDAECSRSVLGEEQSRRPSQALPATTW